jgi:prevent-host-death family protein
MVIMTSEGKRVTNVKAKPGRASQGRWRLTDAKARFSEVVKLASDHPQRITVDGKDAVVIVAATAYDKERAKLTGAALVKAFAHPALAGLEMKREHVIGVHRDIDL